MGDKRMAVALQLRRAIELLVQAAPLKEAESLAIPDLYEPWSPGMEYAPGRILKHGEDGNGDTVLYSVLQAHPSAENWLPGDMPALYKRIGFAEGGIPLWMQPLGAAGAYAKGDTVSHTGKVWVSDLDGNVWAPGGYGWRRKQ